MKHRRFAHFVDGLTELSGTLDARFEEVDEDRFLSGSDDAEHQSRAVGVARLREAIKLIFGHVVQACP